MPTFFATTTDPFIVYTRSSFAIRALVLVFIGSKIFLVGTIGQILVGCR